jgi:uncharacterized protein (DUF2344 family)
MSDGPKYFSHTDAGALARNDQRDAALRELVIQSPDFMRKLVEVLDAQLGTTHAEILDRKHPDDAVSAVMTRAQLFVALRAAQFAINTIRRNYAIALDEDRA